jgi:hypothetical protein
VFVCVSFVRVESVEESLALKSLDFDLNLDKTINTVMRGQKTENQVAWDQMEVSSISIGDPHGR